MSDHNHRGDPLAMFQGSHPFPKNIVLSWPIKEFKKAFAPLTQLNELVAYNDVSLDEAIFASKMNTGDPKELNLMILQGPPFPSHSSPF